MRFIHRCGAGYGAPGAEVRPHGAGLEAVARTGTAWRAGTVVNCTGPGRAHRTALGRALLDSGVGRSDPLGLGLDVDEEGRLVDATGRAHENIAVIGPPRRGRWWETTAVPEIRAQAARLARGTVGEVLAGVQTAACARWPGAARIDVWSVRR